MQIFKNYLCADLKKIMEPKQHNKTGLRFAPGKLSLSINDLREKEFSAEPLTGEERIALQNFDAYRIAELNKEKTDLAFYSRYKEFTVIAKIGDFTERIK